MTPEAFWSRVDKSGANGCWIWNGAHGVQGYGFVGTRRPNGQRTTVGAHRVAYELLVGPIAEGLELDHLCRNPRCVNPAHLEPVTSSVNNRRGVAARTSHDATSPGGRVCKGRAELGMSQLELAELAHLTQPAISQIEHDGFVPREVIRQMIADALRMRESDIWTDADLKQRVAA